MRVGDGNNFAYGEDGVDTLLGASGNDVLDGGPGADTMSGVLGTTGTTSMRGRRDHRIRGLGAADRVFASVKDTIAAGVAVETLSTTSHAGTAAINLIGNEFNNTIIGNAGNNQLGGGGGNS